MSIISKSTILRSMFFESKVLWSTAWIQVSMVASPNGTGDMESHQTTF